jgi:SpoVK/Ycf46/Vps4 family AAA+-type ATPase
MTENRYWGYKRAIVEGELELTATMWYESAEAVNEVIPLVRVFLPEKKTYCYVHVDNISEHIYDKTGFEKVVMPDDVRALFKQVFSAGPEETFGDIFGGRHGGVVVLADGPPGVGKTLTAEAVAELSERPLYVADVGEIGIDLDTVEDKLKLILDRASKWNAVLLLDEADIFLVKRDVDNIERNAIVGTFLKFLDGFDGTLFLTTNRVEVIDPAFASRITARIHYEKLDVSARTKVWRRMVDAAKIEIPTEELAKLAEKTMNGRQIRNVVRLAKMFYRNKPLTAADFNALDKHILKVDETWDAPGKTTTKENEG